MPLILCPNDNSPMQTVDRAGVQFDMCPTCRGVWLDRGELENLMAASAQGSAQPAAPTPPPMAAPRPQPWSPGFGERGEYGERGESGERGEYGQGYGGYRKKRGSIFDIFD